MPARKLRFGDRVRVVGSSDTSIVEKLVDRVNSGRVDRPREAWKVVRLILPDEGGFPYPIKGGRHSLTRLVHERQLALLE